LLHAAYNDSEGVTAAFNINLLLRLNRELGADFDVEHFRHHAIYNDQAGRVEMHLVSTIPQTVHIGGDEVVFEEGESIWTESSYKYTIEEFSAISRKAGYDLERYWVDDNNLFSVQFLSVAD
jgi:uncharacterized SAM-dependent methyltransferase